MTDPWQHYVRQPDHSGDEARSAFEKLPRPLDEFSVEVSYTGGHSLSLRMGRAGDDVAFALCDDTTYGVHLHVCPWAEAQGLFQEWISCLQERQWMIDPSPHSPQYYMPDPDPIELAPRIRKRFGIHVTAMGELE